MYVEYFGLQAAPFQLTPDPQFFFESSVHSRAKAYLTYGLSQGEGFIVITGDVGAGKTTLVGHLLSSLDSARYIAANIVTTQLAADDTLRMVASVFGIPHESADKAVILERIEGFLTAHQSEGRRCLLVVDEAQNLSFESLEELRMLSNFQLDGQAQLQSFLLGQPQFRRTLAHKELDQLRQRVIASYHLGPMNAEETREYVLFRLRAVGWDNNPRFADDAFHTIFEQTGGVPRRINVLCSRLLLFASLEERSAIAATDVAQVAQDLEQETEQVLDHSVPEEAEARPGAAATAIHDDRIVAELNELRQRLVSVEASVRRHDHAFRQALVTFSDYLKTLGGDLERKGDG